MADGIADIGARPQLVQTLRSLTPGGLADAPRAPLVQALSNFTGPDPTGSDVPGAQPASVTPPPFTPPLFGADATPSLFEPLSLRAAAAPPAVAEETAGLPLTLPSRDFAALIEGAGRGQATADQISSAFLDASALV